uniref:Restriction endonuclease subunit S n=1 Tax=Ignisphaera aggregans TaxID=334771 RepID=A0A7J3Z7B3_9CREN
MKMKRLDEFMKKETASTAKQQPTPQHEIIEFYRETEFQETEIGKIPREWKVVKFKEVAEIRKGKRIPEEVKSVAFIPMEAIPDNGLYAKYELRNVNEVKSYVYCEPGDILLAKITPSFENGKQGIVPEELQGKVVLATTEVYPISCKNIDKYFLFYLLKYLPIRNKLTSLMRGTTGRKRVPREALEELLLPYPPITEQQKIAEILVAIDNAIESVDRDIVKLERLKRALMRELLTGRVRVREENGKLVFYRETEFQETEIGKLPREWGIVKLEKIADIITGPFGSQLRKSELTNNGIKVYTQENVLNRNFEIGDLYISKEKFEELKIFEIKPNDILITIRGTIGKATVVPKHAKKGIIHTNLAIIRLKHGGILPEFIELVFNESEILIKQVKSKHSTTTIPALYGKTLKQLKIMLPQLAEQRNIVVIYNSIHEAIEIYHKEKEKLERLKRGLMDLLLTGRVRMRVKPAS